MWCEKVDRLKPDHTLVTVHGWVWGQFMLCLARGEVHIILLCYRDYGHKGHTNNMRLVLLRADLKIITDAAKQLIGNGGAQSVFNTNVIYDEAAAKVTAIHNEHFSHLFAMLSCMMPRRNSSKRIGSICLRREDS